MVIQTLRSRSEDGRDHGDGNSAQIQTDDDEAKDKARLWSAIPAGRKVEGAYPTVVLQIMMGCNLAEHRRHIVRKDVADVDQRRARIGRAQDERDDRREPKAAGQHWLMCWTPGDGKRVARLNRRVSSHLAVLISNS